MNIIKKLFNKKKPLKRICGNCEYQHDVDNCPNSSLCYELDNKPYFKERVKL